jgi:hypothetical protein
MIEHWLEIYAKSTHSEIPAMEARLKSMDADIESKTKRVQNLVSRIAELPTEIPADPFYDQIKETNQKLSELKLAKKELLSKSISLKGQAIDQNGLIEKIKGITARLEETPIENRRPLYSNLIQFAELHTTKIRVGVIAPTLSPNRNDNQMKATGTDGVPGSFANFESNEGKVLKIAAGTRAGSTSVTIGAP